MFGNNKIAYYEFIRLLYLVPLEFADGATTWPVNIQLRLPVVLPASV